MCMGFHIYLSIPSDEQKISRIEYAISFTFNIVKRFSFNRKPLFSRLDADLIKLIGMMYV